MSRDTWLPTIWHFDKRRPRRARVAPSQAQKRKMISSQQLNTHIIFRRQAKALIRLRVCIGRSEALLVAHTKLSEISCTGSYDKKSQRLIIPTWIKISYRELPCRQYLYFTKCIVKLWLLTAVLDLLSAPSQNGYSVSPLVAKDISIPLAQSTIQNNYYMEKYSAPGRSNAT